MLVRIRGGVEGLAEYLRNGRKAGRSEHRDELDERLVLFGNLEQTEALIDAMDTDGERYLHVTLSFREDEVREDTLRGVTDTWRRLAMAGYDDDEYCLYAEAHIPKIKSYTCVNEETGVTELVERYVHIHIAIPKINLVTGEPLNPFGYVPHHEKHLDAIQEKINNQFGLISPKDCPRTSITSASEIIRRHQSDLFGKESRELKEQILNAVIDRKIESYDDFKKLLTEFGQTRTRHGRDKDYENVKPEGAQKGVNLKEHVFSREFVEKPTDDKCRLLAAEADRVYLVQQASRAAPDDIQGLVDDWTTLRAKSVRYLHSQKQRDAYIAAQPEQKAEILAACARAHREKFTTHYAGRAVTAEEPRATAPTKEIDHASRLRARQPDIAILDGAATPETLCRLSGVPSLDLVSSLGGREVLLPGNAHDRVGNGVQDRDRGVRRDAQGAGSSGGGGRESDAGLKPISPTTGRRNDSVVGQMLRDLSERKAVTASSGQADIQTIKRELDAGSLLASLAKSHGLLIDKYAVTKGKDGSDRIRCGTRNLNVGDFLTQEMRLPWRDAEQLLRGEYARQVKGQRFEAKPTPLQQPRKELWAEFAKTRPTAEQRSAAWGQQRQTEKDRRKAITADYYAAKSALDGKPTAGKRAAISLLRMHKLKKEAELRDQIKREREKLKAKHRRRGDELYRDWLHAQAEAGREAALDELRRMRIDPFPVSKPDHAQIKGQPKNTPLYQSLTHMVHRNGDVTYRRDGVDVLRDTARTVNVIKTDRDTIEAGLRLALAKFGPKLELTGTDEFKATAARVAAQAGLRVEFDDPALNKIMQDERAGIEEARQFAQKTRVKLVQRKDGPTIDQRHQDVPVPVERRKERLADKIKQEDTEKPAVPTEKSKSMRIR
jgi:hypothetical protein